MKRTPLKRKTPLRRRAGEITKTCARDGCEETFNIYPQQTKHFCSRECRLATITPARQRTCKQCGENFLSYAPGRIQKFCSRRCQGIAGRRDRRRTCAICGSSFECSKSTGAHTRKTCSEVCRREAGRLAKLGRKNPAYRNGNNGGRTIWRAAVESTCRWCGSTDRLRGHHVVYEQHVRKRGGDVWDVRNCLTLCISCHSKQHNGTDVHVPIDKFRPENFAFAAELLGDYAIDYFDRYYHAERADVLPRLPQQLALEVVA